jgi:hypothetical protein
LSPIALPDSIEPAKNNGLGPDRGIRRLSGIIFMGIAAGAVLFVAYCIYVDVDTTGARITAYLPFLLLFFDLLIAFRVRQRVPRYHGLDQEQTRGQSLRIKWRCSENV